MFGFGKHSSLSEYKVIDVQDTCVVLVSIIAMYYAAGSLGELQKVDLHKQIISPKLVLPFLVTSSS